MWPPARFAGRTPNRAPGRRFAREAVERGGRRPAGSPPGIPSPRPPSAALRCPPGLDAPSLRVERSGPRGSLAAREVSQGMRLQPGGHGATRLATNVRRSSPSPGLVAPELHGKNPTTCEPVRSGASGLARGARKRGFHALSLSVFPGDSAVDGRVEKRYDVRYGPRMPFSCLPTSREGLSS